MAKFPQVVVPGSKAPILWEGTWWHSKRGHQLLRVTRGLESCRMEEGMEVAEKGVLTGNGV